MPPLAKLLIITGLFLVAFGLIWMLAERVGLGRLPGDILIEREGLRVYIPLATSLIVSVVLTLLFWLFSR